MKNKSIFNTSIAIFASLAPAGCVIEDGGGGGGGNIVDQPAPNPTPTPPPGMNRAFNVSWGFLGISKGRIIQRFERGRTLTRDVRICFINDSGNKAELRHNVPGIPSLSARAGGRPRARFTSSLRVSFNAFSWAWNVWPVTARNYNLAPLEGGNLRVTFDGY